MTAAPSCQLTSKVPLATVDETPYALSQRPPQIQLLRCGRSPVQSNYSPFNMDEELLREMEYVKKWDLSRTAGETFYQFVATYVKVVITDKFS